jgi:hypothetical protein
MPVGIIVPPRDQSCQPDEIRVSRFLPGDEPFNRAHGVQETRFYFFAAFEEEVRLETRKYLNWLARPEGFEHPTPRSVVRSNTELERTGEKKRPASLPFSGLLSSSFHGVSQHCGNISGNIHGLKS